MTCFNATIEFKDTKLNCDYQYEPETTGGDIREVLSSFVEVESVLVGDCDVSGLVEDDMAAIETLLLNEHEKEVEL